MDEIKELLDNYKKTLSSKQKFVKEISRSGFTHLTFVGEITQLRIVIADLERVLAEHSSVPQANGSLPHVSVSDVHSFLEWLNNQKKDYMGGEFLYDVKGYYKRLKQGEMFDYWLERVHSR